MVSLRPNFLGSKMENGSQPIELSFHPSFYKVRQMLQNWMLRFPNHEDPSVFQDLFLFYLLAGKKYLDHRHPLHLFRQILAICLMQKKVLHSSTFANSRYLEIKWIPTSLLFPFASKPVIGCLVGFNVFDRYELFDEENVLLILQKYLPHLSLVKESSYSHTSQNKELKIFYFEIEKKDGSIFSLQDRLFLKNSLEQKIKNGIQKLSPTIFMQRNEEEIYKNILILSQEIQSVEDLPQATIVLDQQASDEIVFLVTLLYVSPSSNFSLEARFGSCTFASERLLTVKYLKKHPIEAHIFRIHLTKEASLLRSDSSIDFYSSRQKAVALISAAIGEFRDYNGGILIKQQELLHYLKESFPEIAEHDSELIETFFYALTPLEKQVLLPPKILFAMFSLYLHHKDEKLTESCSLKVLEEEGRTFFVVRGSNSSLKEILDDFLQMESVRKFDIAFNHIESIEGIFFQCVLDASLNEVEPLVRILEGLLIEWQLNIKNRQILRIGFEYSPVSLDPRIGGDSVSNVLSGLLFEGLTRRSVNGNVENGIAEKIEISSDFTQYIFKLRPSCWNDKSPLTAYDFEYAWKKILSPDFATSFAYFFHMIKNAKEAKEGKISPDQIGIVVLDEKTLKVDLAHPCHYFLELTCHVLYSPVHRLIDQQHPQWTYQEGENYPCNGPFQLKINHPGQGYKLIKNHHYWDVENTNLDEIIFNRMGSQQAFEAFSQGEIDWLGYPLGRQPCFIPGETDAMLSCEHEQVCWNVFNTAHGLFQNLKLRQAVAFAIEQSVMGVGSYLPLTPAYSPLLPRHSHNPQARFPQHNIEMARKLWQEGLQELGLEGNDLSSISVIFHHKGILEHIALCLKHQLKETLGIECELKPLAWAVLFDKITKGDFQIGIVQWSSEVDDPIYTLNAFRFGNAEINFPKWEHADYQKLLEESDQEIDPARRFLLFAKAEEILCQEMPVIPLFYLPLRALIKNHLNIPHTTPLKTFSFARGVNKKGVLK
jgi:oligopeptide transport system substrate-binding protein